MAISAGSARAQSAEAPAEVAQADAAATPQRRGSAVEEITVTAEKTEKSLQETALSIQAFGADDITKLGLEDAKDTAKFTPGMLALPGTSANIVVSFTGRGVGERDNHPSMPQSVGLYVDGFYIGTGMGTNFGLLDIERFEMLKGPQGTLFGRNTIGGAVSITTVKPQPELGGSVKLGAGMYKERSGRVSLNVPLIGETLLSRITLFRKVRDPFDDNDLSGGDDYSDANDTAGRLALRWLATDAVTVDWSIEKVKLDLKNPAAHMVQLDPATRGLGLAAYGVDLAQYIDRERGDIATNGRQFAKLDSLQNVVTLTWDVAENATIKSISGWRRYRWSGDNDLDGTPFTLFHSGDHNTWHRTFYQELQAVGSLLDGRVEYAGGLTWFQEKDRNLNWQMFMPEILTVASGGPFGNQTSRMRSDNQAWGIYSQWTLHATDRLHLTGGIRYSNERKEAERGVCGFNFATFTPPDVTRRFTDCIAGGGAFVDLDPAGPGVLDNRVFRSDNWAPLAKVAYDWTDELMTYLSWTRGYRSGGFSVRFGSAAVLPAYDDETVSQWEMGFKSRWFDNRLQLNGSAFYSQFDDMQVSNWISTAAGVQTIRVNAGRSRIRGVELDAIAVPVEGLTLRLTHGWTRADFSEYKECPPPAAPGCTELDRSEMYRVAVTPKRTWAGLVSYMLPAMGIGTLELSGNFRRSSTWSLLSPIEQARNTATGRYIVYGARATLYDAFGVNGLSLAVVGSNLSDRSYSVSGIDFGSETNPLGFTMAAFGDPRHVVFEVGYEF
jgi:iron complex outermembrane receptor protein